MTRTTFDMTADFLVSDAERLGVGITAVAMAESEQEVVRTTRRFVFVMPSWATVEG